MVDLSALSSQDIADQNALAAQAPAASPATGIGEAFSAAREANDYYGDIGAAYNAQEKFLQGRLDQFKAQTGEEIANPITVARMNGRPAGDAAMDYARQRFAQAPDRLHVQFPTDDEIAQGGLQISRSAVARQAQASQNQTWGALLGSLTAQTVDGATDPLNVMAMSVVPEAGLLARAASAAGGFAGASIIDNLAAGPYRRAVNPDYTFGVKDVAAAALQGAGFELGGALLGKVAGAGWRRLVNRAPDAAASLPLPARDAGEVAARQADLDAQNPFQPGPAGEAAHAEAMAKAEEATLTGQPVEPSEAAEALARAPTGTVFAGPPESAEAAPRDASTSLSGPPSSGEGRAFYGGNRAVNVRYELAEARDLVTSHDDGFHANPDYPADWQPRNRGGKPATEQVMQIASNLTPERLGPSVEANSGAPIVGPDNIVESGNGRAMAIRRVYATDGAGAYRAFLERSGYDTTGFKEPVLIGRRTTPMNDAEREEFAHAANGSASLGMSPAEQAMSDARFLTPDIARLAQPGEVTSAANRDFVRGFLSQFGQGERGRLQGQSGELSAVGVNRLRAAMFARAYGDPAVVARLYEHTDPNIKTIGHALSASASDWIKMRDAVTRGDIPATQDVTGNLMEAVRAIMRARDEGRPVSEILSQGDMFVSDTTPLVARLFTRSDDTTRFLSKDKMAANVSAFARDLRTGAEKGVDLFGEPPRTAEQVLADMLSRARSDETADEIANNAAHDESLFAGLERSVEQGDNKFVREDGQVGIADAELAQIKSDESLAQEISACTVTAPAEAAE